MADVTSNATQRFFLTPPNFGVVDYIVFSGFLCISGAVGIFFSVRGQKNTGDYFFGGKKMRPVPMGISTGVSYQSAAALVGAPAEMFINGYSYMIGIFSGSLGFFLGCVLVSVVLHPLQVTSVNEYIARRFKSRVLTYVTNVFVLICILEYTGVCMLGSVIAFSSATGGQVSVAVALVIGGTVGIFYTSIGGLKAVVWTDVIQSVTMLVGIAVVVVKSIIDTPGGLAEITRLNIKYKRLHEPIWTADLTIRHTIWGLVFGLFVYRGSLSVQPSIVQRLCSTPTKNGSIIVGAIASLLFFCFMMLPAWAGLNIFGYYISKGCDVYSAGWIKNNEIILYYVRERLNFPGFQGLFIAALFAGSLSSLSSCLNAASAIFWNDTIKPLLKSDVSEARATLFSKLFVVVFGVVGMIWCFVLHSFGGLILQVIATIDASMYGAYFGLFLVPLLFRSASSKGVLAGLVVSFIFTLWLGLCSLLYGETARMIMPSVTHKCIPFNSSVPTVTSIPLNVTLIKAKTPCKSFFTSLYSISYEWMTLICVVVSFFISLLVTGCFKQGKLRNSEENLLLPFCRKKQSRRRCCRETGNVVINPSDGSDDEEIEEEKGNLNIEMT